MSKNLLMNQENSTQAFPVLYSVGAESAIHLNYWCCNHPLLTQKSINNQQQKVDWNNFWMRISKHILETFSCFLKVKPFGVLASIDTVVSVTRVVHKRHRNFFGCFWYPSPPCWKFDPDLPNFYLLISCNIRIWDDPSPLNIPIPRSFKCLLTETTLLLDTWHQTA